jgi:NAD-dependent DNA ligase
MTLTINELEIIIEGANGPYYNSGEPVMTDREYDDYYNLLKSLDPYNPLILGAGAEVRGDKVKLPVPMNGLVQKNISDITKMITDSSTLDDDYVITAKMDGVSVLLVYNNSKFSKGYSRGNTIEGADWTRHLLKIDFPKSHQSLNHKSTVIRGELIISKEDFVSSGLSIRYATPRNAVSGLMNRKTITQQEANAITLFVYDIVNDEENSKFDKLKLLMADGFTVVDRVVAKGNDLNEKFLLQTLDDFEKSCPLFDKDGLVITANYSNTVAALTKNNYDTSIKFKINGDGIIVDVEEVVWDVSKSGYLKPRVRIKPTNIGGVEVSYATGFNAKFIIDNEIGLGAKIKMVRSGDVIPHIVEVIEPAPDGPEYPSMPCDEYEFTESGVDFVLTFPEHDPDVLEKNHEFFLKSIGVKHIGLMGVKKLVNAGWLDFPDYFKADEEAYKIVLGVNGSKAFNSIWDLNNTLQEHVFAGALPVFGRDIGETIMKKVFDKYMNVDVYFNDLMEVDGISEITATKIMAGKEAYASIREEVLKTGFRFAEKSKIKDTLKGVVVVFSKVRDKELKAMIENNGGRVVGSVSKNTTHLITLNPSDTSSKLDKARSLGVEILSLDQARNKFFNNMG